MERFITRPGIKKRKGSSTQPLKSSSECDSDPDDPAINQDEASQIEPGTAGAGSDVSTNKPKNKRKKYSVVWKYFKRSGDRKLAKCITCGKEYKTSGNTSNLSDHLKRFHPILSENTDDNPEMVASLDSCTNASTSSSARSSIRSISPFFKRGIYYDNSSQRKKLLDRAVLEMITADFQPFSVVSDAGFNKLVALLDPRYKLPSSYILNNILKEAYLEEFTKLQNVLSEIDFVAVTTDSWTSIATESYLTVTCHFVDENFNLKSHVLSTKPLPNGINHTSENIADALKNIFDEWHIGDKVIYIVTDNAANMIKACGLLKIKHLPCYAHTLNLVVQDNLKLVQDILKKAKDIVTFFKSSPLAMDTFKNEQNVKEPLKLIQEVQTRWNSTFFMIQRIIQTNDALGRALLKLRRAPPPLTVDDMAILGDIEKVLSCFQEATKKISGNAYVTISVIIPITFGIQNFLKNSLNELTTEEGKTFCRNLAESVEKRLAPYETRSAPRFGTILDPRFKKEGFRSTENATATAKLLENEMYSLSQKSQQEENHGNSTQPLNLDLKTSSTTSTSSSALFGFLQQRLDEKVKSVTVDVIVTKRQYLERQNAPNNTDPLEFWKITGNELCPMNLLAKKYFCVPATSVDSERIFSSTGLVISDRRSRLKSDKVNMIVFLHKNK